MAPVVEAEAMIRNLAGNNQICDFKLLFQSSMQSFQAVAIVSLRPHLDIES